MDGEAAAAALEEEAEEATVGVEVVAVEVVAVAAAGAVVAADVMETGLARELESHKFCMHAQQDAHYQ